MVSIQQSIANVLRGDSEYIDLMPGGIWTRRIKRNDAQGPVPTPGSTPDAFDSAGRILRCTAVLNGESSRDATGPLSSFYAFPEIWLRCLPHETQKAKLDQAAMRIIELLDGAVVPFANNQQAVLTVVGQIGPDDDPELQPAVVHMIRLQVDSVWSVR